MKKLLFFIILFLLLITPVMAVNKSVIDITELTMTEEIEYLEKGVITSEELVNLYLDRINAYNKQFNALITVNENIIEEAKEMDELRLNGEIKGRLHGIPIIVKDNIDVKGMPTTAGAKALADNYPIEDAEVIKKLKDEGAIVIAKANMSEFAFSAADSNSSYGYVSNAFKIGYTSYGSSGGSAVAVALNFGSVALGTDTNSSVRLPAGAAGLVGIRPTFGKLSTDGVIAYDVNRDTVGVISKSVQDNKLIMEILTGESYDTSTEEKIRIGIPKSFYEGSNSYIPANKKIFEPIKKMLDEEIERLENEGIEIVFLDDFYGTKEYSYNYSSIAGFTMCKAFNEYIKGTTGKIRSFKDLVNSKGKISSLSGYYKGCNYSSNDLKKVFNTKDKLKATIDAVYENNDLDFIMYPSTKNEIYKRGQNGLLLNVSTTVSSVTGFPALILPLGYYDGMPYGLELMARSNEEEKLYEIASIIEKHNYLVNSQETAADKLYEVSSDDIELVQLYMDNYEDVNKKEWLSKVYNFFRDNDGDSRKLIEEFSQEIVEDNEKELHVVILQSDAVAEELGKENYLIYNLGAIALILLVFYFKYSRRRKRY